MVLEGWQLALLVPVGIVAGIVNTLAGGGTFLTVPFLVWLGVPAPVANGTARIGVLTQSGAASLRFRAEAVDAKGELWAQIGVSGTGAAVGAGLALLLDAEALDRVLGVAMLVAVAVALARPAAWREPGPARWTRWPALFVIGAYGGFAQAGVGVALLPALVVLGGLDPVAANARKSVLVAAFTVPSLAVFAAAGLVDLRIGAVLAVCAGIGGAIGAHLTVGYGARLVWAALVVVVVLNALRLVTT